MQLFLIWIFLQWKSNLSKCLLPEKELTNWKTNEKVVIKDIKTNDIEKDIKDLEIKNYASIYGLDFTERKMDYYLRKAKETEGFHYLAAYHSILFLHSYLVPYS